MVSTSRGLKLIAGFGRNYFKLLIQIGVEVLTMILEYSLLLLSVYLVRT